MIVWKVPRLTLVRLQELLTYDPSTGQFFRAKNCSSQLKNMEAGTITRFGYRQISMDNEKIFAHRLAWFWTYAKWPRGALDHANRNRLDNRICNLREATMQLNMANSLGWSRSGSGLKGAYYNTRTKKWWSAIKLNYAQIYLGTFNSEAEAHAAYVVAAINAHGSFANAGTKSLTVQG